MLVKEKSFQKRRCSVRFVGSPSTAHETSPFAPPWLVSMPRAVGVVFADGLVAFHAVEQQSRGHEFHHHHLGERAVVHLAYGDKSTRSHNRYHQSFQYCPHNPVFFVGCRLLPWVVSHHRHRRLSSAPCSNIAELHGIRT